VGIAVQNTTEKHEAKFFLGVHIGKSLLKSSKIAPKIAWFGFMLLIGTKNAIYRTEFYSMLKTFENLKMDRRLNFANNFML